MEASTGREGTRAATSAALAEIAGWSACLRYGRAASRVVCNVRLFRVAGVTTMRSGSKPTCMATIAPHQAPRWCGDRRASDSLQVALDHINEALEYEALGRPGWPLAACESLFKAFKQLANSLDAFRPASETGNRRGETSKYQALLTRLTSDARDRLVAQAAVRDLALFQPFILSHSADGMSQAPLAELPADVLHAASADHRRLRKAWQRWNEGGSRSREVCQALVLCVLVVRNNAFHGERPHPGPIESERGGTVMSGRLYCLS